MTETTFALRVYELMGGKPENWMAETQEFRDQYLRMAADTLATVTPAAYGEGMDEGDWVQMLHDSIPPEMWGDMGEQDSVDRAAERYTAEHGEPPSSF